MRYGHVSTAELIFEYWKRFMLEGVRVQYKYHLVSFPFYGIRLDIFRVTRVSSI